MKPKYPHVRVQLTGRDGNAFAILSAVRAAMRRALLPESECEAFFREATAGDYDHLLATAMRCTKIDGVTIISGSSAPVSTISSTSTTVVFPAIAISGLKLRAAFR